MTLQSSCHFKVNIRSTCQHCGVINMAVTNKFYKWCFVPTCTNTSINNPNKHFITVPTEYSKKFKWFKAVRRDMPKSRSSFICCEDHFNLEADMENYVRFKLIGGKIKLKQDVVPHIFEDEIRRTRATSTPEVSAFIKRQRQDIVKEILESSVLTPIQVGETEASTSNVNIEEINTFQIDSAKSKVSGQSDEPVVFKRPDQITELNLPSTNVTYKSIGVQARPYYRSKYTLYNSKKNITHTASSPIKITTFRDQPTSLKKLPSPEIVESTTTSSSSETISYVPTSDCEFDEEILRLNRKQQHRSLLVTRHLIQTKPKNYVGVPDSWFSTVLQLLSCETKINQDNIILTLMKIKLNDSFSRLGDLFGMSTSNASKVFQKTLLKIEPHLSTLLYWPREDRIKYNLPIPFRAKYNKVQSIIDCFEIQIEKPSEPVKQSLTWSEDKKCNTLKYLISSTPDGFINFISSGYGGRISDSLLVQESGYLNVVPTGCSVMADRGFKDIGRLLREKNCILIRPPSVSSTTKPTKTDILETKVISSLRIHIERIIRRIREFSYLTPHAVIQHDLIAQTDCVIKVACALINLQTSY